jgi:hypothetical protein
MTKEKNGGYFVAGMVLFFIVLAVSVHYFFEKIDSKYETVKTIKCRVIEKKYDEIVYLGGIGNIETVRYFLYTDGVFEKEVDVETYLRFSEGDQVCRTFYVRIKK